MIHRLAVKQVALITQHFSPVLNAASTNDAKMTLVVLEITSSVRMISNYRNMMSAELLLLKQDTNITHVMRSNYIDRMKLQHQHHQQQQ